MKKTKRTSAQLLGQTIAGVGKIVDVKRTQVRVRTSSGFTWVKRPN